MACREPGGHHSSREDTRDTEQIHPLGQNGKKSLFAITVKGQQAGQHPEQCLCKSEKNKQESGID